MWGWFGNPGKSQCFDGLWKRYQWNRQDLGLVWKSRDIAAFGFYTEETSGLGADLKILGNCSAWMVLLKKYQGLRLIRKPWNFAAFGFYTEEMSRLGAGLGNPGKLPCPDGLVKKH